MYVYAHTFLMSHHITVGVACLKTLLGEVSSSLAPPPPPPTLLTLPVRLLLFHPLQPTNHSHRSHSVEPQLNNGWSLLVLHCHCVISSHCYDSGHAVQLGDLQNILSTMNIPSGSDDDGESKPPYMYMCLSHAVC